ncbi:hypothetical protein M0638_28250, partial [Roseomonas sp. NAR14]
FKGSLIDTDEDTGECHYCAQGDALHLAGWSDERLHNVEQEEADRAVAELLGVSRFQAVLLRQVNDRRDGAPQIVLTNPERVIGDQAPIILAFARHLDAMTAEELAAAWDAARGAAGD